MFYLDPVVEDEIDNFVVDRLQWRWICVGRDEELSVG